MQSWFISDVNLIQENSNIDDLLDLSEYINRYFNKVESYQDRVMLWLKWRFWIWKSTFLNQFSKRITEDNNTHWFEFDAWKYPNRENLWENFILEFARSFDEKEFDKILRKVDGKTASNWVEKFIDFSSWFHWSIKNFNNFLNTSPARRTFEVQLILEELILSIKKEKIYIIVEDIDRSWDKWIYFLETLNYFVKNTSLPEVQIKIIVPISDESYEAEKYAYHKCLDDIETYNQPNYDLKNFCNKVFITELREWLNLNIFSILVELLEGLFIFHWKNITLRELKFLLRKSNSLYMSIIKEYTPDIKVKNITYILCIIISIQELINIQDDVKGNYYENSINIWKFNGPVLLVTTIYSLLTSYNSIYEDKKNNKLRSIRKEYRDIVIKNCPLAYFKSNQWIDFTGYSVQLSDFYYK